TFAIGLGNPELAAFKAVDDAPHQRPGGTVDFVLGERGAALECALDRELQFGQAGLVGACALAWRGGPGGGGLLRRLCHQRGDPAGEVSGSRRARNSARKACWAASSSGWSCSSVIWNRSSARSPKVAMRASCTRR